MFLKTVLVHRLWRILLLVGLFQLYGCVTHTVRTVDMAPPETLRVPPSE